MPDISIQQGDDAAGRLQKKTDLIVQTSFDLFKEKGFENVSVDSICQRCRITKPTFYKYISSKDYLLESYFSRVFDSSNRNAQAYFDEKNYEEALMQGLLGFNDLSVEIGPNVLKNYIVHRLKQHQDSVRYKEPLQQTNLKSLNFYLADADFSKAEDKEIYEGFIPEDSLLLYRILTFQQHALLIEWAVSSGDFDLKEVSRQNAKKMLQVLTS